MAAFAVGFASPALRGADPATAEKPVFMGPAPPEELKILASLVGQWKTEATAKPSLAHKDGLTSKGEQSWQWIHNGHFLRLEGSSISKAGRFEYSEIISYHRNTKKFRRFVFSTDGIAAETIGEWDPETKTMTWTAVGLPEGWSAVGKTILGKDKTIFTLFIKNNRDETVRDVVVTAERKK
jgi:hypothetical protein